MKTHHPENERMKRHYLEYLREANGYSEASLDSVAKALSRFEECTCHRDFRSFRPEQAKAFKAKLAEHVNVRTGERLSKATLSSTMAALKAFFKWLAGQPGYKSKLSYSDADYFNLTANDARVAKAHRGRPVPTLGQIEHVLANLPSATDIEKRNRAMIAFTILTGARDGAMASLRLKHVDVVERKVIQDAREVNTKARKSFTTWFFPVGDIPLRIVIEWVEHLQVNLQWGSSDPLFPKTRIEVRNNGEFAAVGLERANWTSAQPIRKIFKDAFRKAGLAYFNPHSFRNTLAQLGERVCNSPETFKAWSQNLGHEGVLTTLTSYGEVPEARQGELIRQIGESTISGSNLSSTIAAGVQAALQNAGLYR